MGGRESATADRGRTEFILTSRHQAVASRDRGADRATVRRRAESAAL